MGSSAAALACALVWAGAVAAQPQPYADEGARRLHEAAMDAQRRTDRSVVQYTALVRQRIGASLRTPLKDRTLYRSESAQRVFWNRDGGMLVQVLAYRAQTPVGVIRAPDPSDIFNDAFDPVGDRLFFGMAETDEDLGEPGDEDFWFEHPLRPEYVSSYDFSTGDTLTLALPDGRTVQAVELRVIPTVADVHRMSGSLWIEPRSGALVRAVYRLSDTFDAFRDIPDLQEEEEEDLEFIPGILKPWTFDLTMVAVDYALWDFDVWLPRSMRAEGVVGAGIFKVPAAIDVSYDVEAVVTENDLAEEAAGPPVPEARFRTRREAMAYLARMTVGDSVPYVLDPSDTRSNGRAVRFLMPEDPAWLLRSPELPPPIWEDAPGFASERELTELFQSLADLPTPPVQGIPSTLRWGLQRPDLVRYNRVEGLSVGVRGQIRPQTWAGPITLSAVARIGVADRHPNARLDVVRETLRRRVTLSGFHELAAVDERARHLDLGNSLNAALFGRDDGDYYRRTGAWLEWTPPTPARRSFGVRAFAEYHEPVGRWADFALGRAFDGDWHFRDNLVAEEGWDVGGLVTVSPWWGTDPNLAQGGLDLSLLGSRGGDFEYLRGALTARTALPLPQHMRLGLEAAGGTSTGALPAQRAWYLGGPPTLRGYGPRTLVGPDFVRARAELQRRVHFGAVAVFADGGWAGARELWDADDALWSLGLGVSLLDGLIRLDVARGMRDPIGFRFDAYLDGVL